MPLRWILIFGFMRFISYQNDIYQQIPKAASLHLINPKSYHMKATKLGIWMDHEHAHLTEFTSEPMKTTTIGSKSTHQVKEQSIHRGENHMHTKDQHLESSYYKELSEIIKQYNEVILFGPTLAKKELFNFMSKDHLHEGQTITIQPADKMTENQMHAFVRKHFSKV